MNLLKCFSTFNNTTECDLPTPKRWTLLGLFSTLFTDNKNKFVL